MIDLQRTIHFVTVSNPRHEQTSDLSLGVLHLHDIKMTDQKRSNAGKCRTWKMIDLGTSQVYK